MKFSLARNIKMYHLDESGAPDHSVITWNADGRFLYHLSLAGRGSYELALNRAKNPSTNDFEVPDVGIVSFGFVHEWDQIGPVFLTKMRSAGIIVACKLMRALEPVEQTEVEAATAAVRVVADEYGGVKMLSKVCPEGVESHEDGEVCMIDEYFRRKRERDE